MIKILFLAPNPSDTARLGLDEEYREIKNRLNRERFDLDSQWAVRPGEIIKSVMEVKPHIVHFAGHGLETGELCVQDDEGNTVLLRPKALADLFELTIEHVKCVVINTCYSQIQAKAIAEHIPFVVGMENAIGDKAAIEFAIGFYTALESDQSIENIERAVKLGRVAVQMSGIPKEHLTPVLILGDVRNRFRAEVLILGTQLQYSSTSAIIYREALLERGRQMGLLVSEAKSIIEEVIEIFDIYQKRLKNYKERFEDAVRDEFPLEAGTQQALKFLQQELELRDEDVSLIEKEILNEGRWKTPEAFFDRGAIQFALGEYQKALKYLTQAIELRPEYSGAFMERGATQAKLGDFKASIADYDSAIKINSNWENRSMSTAYIERGRSYYNLALKEEDRTDNMNAAIQDWSESIRLRPNSSLTYYNRALAYTALDENEKAIQDYTTAIQVNSEWGSITIAHAYQRREIAYRAISDFSAANEDLRLIAELNKANPDLRIQHPNLRAILDFAETRFGEQTDLVDNKPVMEQI